MKQDGNPVRFSEVASDVLAAHPAASAKDGFQLVSERIRLDYLSGRHSGVDILHSVRWLLKQRRVGDALCVLSAIKNESAYSDLFRLFSRDINAGAPRLVYIVGDFLDTIRARDVDSRPAWYGAVANILSSAESVLDVGCGGGLLGEALKGKSDRIKVTGVDFLLRDGPRIAEHYDSFEQCDAIAGDRVWDVDATAIISVFAYVEMDAALAFLKRMKPHTKQFLFNAITSDHVWRDYPKIVQIYDRAEFEAGIRALGLDLLSEKAQDMDRTWYLVAEPSNLSASLWHEHLPALINGEAS